MAKKVTTSVTKYNPDTGAPYTVTTEQSCGPVCTTVKVVGAVGLLAVALGALSSKN